MRIPGVTRKTVNRDEIWAGRSGLPFRLHCFLFFHPLVPLHSWGEVKCCWRNRCQERVVCFIKTKTKGKRIDLTSVCFFSPFYCEWGCFGVEGWDADAPAGLAAMSSSFCVRLGTFHWHRMQSDWQTSILHDPRGCWKFCSRIYHENIHILFSFRAYSWINTTQKKQNEMQMAMTQQHMMYTNKHSRFDSWNFNQF